MLYDIEVRPGPNSEFFQYYTETVEASTAHEAVSRVQRRNPGCNVHCTNSYNSSRQGSSSLDFIDSIVGLCGLIGFLLLFWVIVEYWSIILPVGIILGILCFIGWVIKDD